MAKIEDLQLLCQQNSHFNSLGNLASWILSAPHVCSVCFVMDYVFLIELLRFFFKKTNFAVKVFYSF